MDTIIVIMFVGLLIVGGALLVLISLSKRGTGQLDKKLYQQEWLSIENSVGGDPSSQQFAILRADKLLDKALRESGYQGETMAERMKQAAQVFTRRDSVWSAHKLRNRIAHDDTVAINPNLTKRALASFKRALKDVGAI